MQVADQPDDSDGQRNRKKEKNDLAFPPLFAQRPRTPGASALIRRGSTLRPKRDTESFTAPIIFWFLVRAVFFDHRHLCNKPLEFFQPLTQFRFLSRNFFLPAAKRGLGLGKRRNIAITCSPAKRKGRGQQRQK